ncbi:MAG: endonuclease III [bacterium]|nr:endonuclease III [bacterium]MDZ4295881.1 endonuclease III [Patescibacteria group bacterium]
MPLTVYQHQRSQKETLQSRASRAKEILQRLKKRYPRARIALRFSNHWEMLVAIILSAQCTDKKVNEVTAALFKKYRTLEDYVGADLKEFERVIRPTGFYHAKAKNILATARIIKEKFGGKLPRTMAEMLTLRGVARKTANIALGNAYGVVEGVAVDTHVKRLSRRLGLSDSQNPERIERGLMQLFPKREWFKLTYRLIDHGRAICAAKDPRCDLCPLADLCPSAFQFPRFEKHNGAVRKK